MRTWIIRIRTKLTEVGNNRESLAPRVNEISTSTAGGVFPGAPLCTMEAYEDPLGFLQSRIDALNVVKHTVLISLQFCNYSNHLTFYYHEVNNTFLRPNPKEE